MNSLFQQALERNDFEAVDVFLRHGENVNGKFTKNDQCLGRTWHYTSLTYLCSKGHVESLDVLLKHGAEPNCKDDHGIYPIHTACASGSVSCIQLLLDHPKINVDIANSNGSTALHVTVSNGHVECLKQLLPRAKDINVRNGSGSTALHLAAASGKVKSAQMLLAEEKIDVNIKANDGSTPLHKAAQYGHTKIVEILMRCEKIDVAATNSSGKNAFQVSNSLEIAKLINTMIEDRSNVSKETLLKKKTIEKKKKELDDREKQVDRISKEIYDLEITAMDNEISMAQQSVNEVATEISEAVEKINGLKARIAKLKEEKPALDQELAAVLQRKEDYLETRRREDIRSIECPICTEVMKLPKTIFQCNEGHCFCSGCHPQLTHCPICRIDIRANFSRCRVLENLINNGKI